MSESGDESRTAAVGRKRKQVSEADLFGAAAAAGAIGGRGVKSRRLSMASKESGEVSSSGEASRRSSNAFSSYEDFKKTAGQDRPQSTRLDDDSSDEEGEIVESDDASMSESESESESEEESGSDDSPPSHARASASPDNTNHTNEEDTNTMITKPYPDGMLRLHQLSNKDQDEQYKYFGLNADNDIIFCTCCGDRGHQAGTCPTRRCTHCNAYDQHTSHSCPTYRKCTRCRQRGHDAPQCTNPRPILIGNDTCDICGESGHVEEECAKLWFTSLKPPLKDIDKKDERRLYKACYNCGESGFDAHWGDDCPDRYYDERTQGPNLVKTWSKRDAAKFVYEDEDGDDQVEDDEDEDDDDEADDDEDDESKGEYQAKGQKEVDPAPSASRNWQVGLFDD